jgi:hypothetical protein
MDARMYKKIILISLIIIIFAVSSVDTMITNADNHIDPRFLEEPQEEQILKPIKPDATESSEFVPLAPILWVTDAETAKDTSAFFSGAFKLGITIAGFLAVIMIAVGGLQYMSTDTIGGKGEGRERITYAIMGLLLILFAWILLSTINPDIVSLRLFSNKGESFQAPNNQSALQDNKDNSIVTESGKDDAENVETRTDTLGTKEGKIRTLEGLLQSDDFTKEEKEQMKKMIEELKRQ